MKKYLLQIILWCIGLLLNISIYGQTTKTPVIADETIVFQQLTGKSYIDRSLVNKGIFFRSFFLPGKIIFESGDSIQNIFLRYESLSENLVWLSDGMGQVELDTESIVTFELKNGDTTFLFSKHLIKSLNDSVKRFYQVYPESKLQLRVLRKVSKQDSYIKKKQYYIYAPTPVYILTINNQEYLLKKPNIKNLTELFPHKREVIIDQLKQSSLKIKNEEDFISLLKMLEDDLIL